VRHYVCNRKLPDTSTPAAGACRRLLIYDHTSAPKVLLTRPWSGVRARPLGRWSGHFVTACVHHILCFFFPMVLACRQDSSARSDRAVVPANFRYTRCRLRFKFSQASIVPGTHGAAREVSHWTMTRNNSRGTVVSLYTAFIMGEIRSS